MVKYRFYRIENTSHSSGGKIPIQDGERPPYWKMLEMLCRLSMDRFGRKLGGDIPSCPQYVCHDAVAMVMAVA